ncbi:MAG: twin-arginine translocation signal domain-containing protein [Caldilineaceae bacterium]|nr:twin-arginine translocation signal domain-containing protein [Caldilineaceae bacterium]
MTMQNISRRDFLRTSGLVVGSAALAACAAPGAAPAASEGDDAMAAEPQTISWWYAWGNLDPAVESISQLESFQAHIGENTTLDYRGSTNNEAVLTALAAGDPPDGGSNMDYPGLWSRGVCLPVNDMVDSSEIIDPNEVVDAVWQGGFYGADLIGVPSIESFLWYGLNYNAQHVEEAGLDPDNPPLTWEGVMEWHKELSQFDDGGNVLRIGLDPIDAMAGEPDFIATSYGHTWWNDEEQTFHLDHELMAQGIETQAEFFRFIGPDNFAGLRSVEGQGTWGAAFNAEVQSMIIEGYWHAGETTIQKPEVAVHNRATWAPVPAFREGAKIMATGPHMVQIYRDGKNPDGIFKVAEFLHTEEPLNIIFHEVGWIMGIQSWLPTIDVDTFPGLRFYIENIEEVTDWIVGRRSPIHWFVNTQLWDLREQVYRDLITPQEAVAELQKRAEDEWEAQGL